MISEWTQQHLEALDEDQQKYRPDEFSHVFLGYRSAELLTGVSAGGKTTIIKAVEEIKEEGETELSIGMSGTFTSRPWRPDDHPYLHHVGHNDLDLKRKFDRIRMGKVVQYAIHPGGWLYGTEVWDYPHLHNLNDVLPAAVAGYQRYGFGAVRAYGIMVPPDTWQPRFDKRFPIGHPFRLTRLQEGDENLAWQLEQPPEQLHLIQNDDRRLAAKRIIQIISDQGADVDVQAWETGLKLHQRIKILREQAE